MTDEFSGDENVSGAPSRDLIAVHHYSTDELAPEDRYRAWYLRDWPRSAPIYRTEPTEPFDTRWQWVQLGSVMFVHTEITAMRWERRLDDIRASDFDPIIISMMVQGTARGDFDGRAFHETDGTFHFHDLARPSLHSSTASTTYNLLLPRPLAAEWFGTLEDLHGLVVPQAEAAIVFAHAAQVHALLPTLDASQAERLGRVFLELLAVTLGSVRPKAAEVVAPMSALRQRAIDLIESQLGLQDLSVESLGRALGVPRSRLFAAFKPDGGVRAFAMTLRLDRARGLLADLSNSEGIGAMAHRLGFSDAAHLSRTFRQRYGMTPREYRHLLRVDCGMLDTAPAPETPVQV